MIKLNQMTLLEKINHLNLMPRNAPAGVKRSTFGEWLRKLRAGQDVGEIPAVLIELYCNNLMNAHSPAEISSEQSGYSDIGPAMPSVAKDAGKAKKVLVATKQEVEQAVSVPPKKPTVVPIAWRTGDSWAGEGRFFKKGLARNPNTGKFLNCHKFSINEGATSVGLAVELDGSSEFEWNGTVLFVSDFVEVK